MKKIIYLVIVTLLIICSLSIIGCSNTENTTNTQNTANIQSQTEKMTLEYLLNNVTDDHTSVNMTFDWDWNFFSKDRKDRYDTRLAIPAAILARASEQSKEDVEKQLTTMGFIDFESRFYDHKLKDRATFTLGTTKQKVDGKDTVIIVAVIRGADFTSVNDLLTMGKSINNHYDDFEKNCRDYIDRYIKKEMKQHQKDGKDLPAKLYIIGHSLGSTVVDRFFIHGLPYFEWDDIFGYAYATPSTASKELKANVKNCGIWNILFTKDLVPNLVNDTIKYKTSTKDEARTSKYFSNYEWFDINDSFKDKFKSLTSQSWDDLDLPGKENAGSNSNLYHSVDTYLSYILSKSDDSIEIAPITK